MNNIIAGPRSYEIWKGSLLNNREDYNRSREASYEVPLFTDFDHITGEITEHFGPYQFLNALNFSIDSMSVDPNIPSIILRIYDDFMTSSHKQIGKFDEMKITDDKYYHGGLLYDEIAALASLILGIRLKSGGITRLIIPDEDIRGKPFGIIDKNPILLKGYKPIIPNAYKRILPLKLPNDLDKLLTYPKLDPEDAMVLVKVSRIYQDALWIAEYHPELSWILFVSAIETAANHWNKLEIQPIEKLHASMPDLEKVLFSKGDIDFVKKVAELIVPYMGATKKFIDFILEFLPDVPNIRPKHGMINWEKNKIKKVLDIVYKYRSDALHDGKSFPAPMCISPGIFGDFMTERPIGMAVTTKGGYWKEKDIPILLHTFEYITRGSLIKWWDSLISR